MTQFFPSCQSVVCVPQSSNTLMHPFRAQGLKSMKIFNAIVISSLAPSVIAFLNTPWNKLWQNYGRIMNDCFL